MKLLDGHFQNAYVTRNIDAAIEQFRGQFGIEDWFSYAGEMEVTTPSGRATLANKVAVGWAGNLQCELIEPISSEVGIFSEALPPNPGLRLHHIGMRVKELGVARQRIESLGFPIVLEGETGVRFFYADARAMLGHYLEFVEMPDEIWRMMGGR